MINLDRTQQLTDIIHNTISYSGLEGAIISTPIFNRLHRILQNSLVYLTYSSNKVKRFEHCVGTMYLSGEILYNAVNNTIDKQVVVQLINESKDEIKKWYSSVDFTAEVMLKDTYSDKYTQDNLFSSPVPNNDLYRGYLPHNINSNDDKYAYLVLFQSTRLAGLLHDVGHLPYSHVFEYAVNLLYAMVEDEENKNSAQKNFLNIMKQYCENDKDLHEEIGFQLLKQIKAEISKDLSKEITENNIFVLAVLNFTEKILSSTAVENTVFSDIHRIVSGILDSDRLDYCSRDAFCTGLTKDIFPYQRLLSTYKIILHALDIDQQTRDENNIRKRILFCPALKNAIEVEDLLDRRWKIFSQINYHHRVHKHEIMFSEILARIGFGELKDLGERDIPSVETKDPLPLKLYSIWSLVKKLQEGNVLIDYLIIQLDDSWMDTLLKNAFFEKYKSEYRDEDKFSNDYEWNMFDELISTKKRYYTCYKRSVNFLNFDKKFCDEWYNKNKHVLENGNNHSSLEYKLVTIIKMRKVENNNKAKPFSFNLIMAVLIKDSHILFYQEVEKRLNNFLKTEKGKKTNIIHCLIRPCNFSIGCYNAGAPVYFWGDDNSGKRFDSISLKSQHLNQLKESYVPFHLYYLPAENASLDFTQLENNLIDIMLDLLPEYYSYTKSK